MMIVIEKTRWIALGMLAGTAILLILAAGACVALLFAYSSSSDRTDATSYERCLEPRFV